MPAEKEEGRTNSMCPTVIVWRRRFSLPYFGLLTMALFGKSNKLAYSLLY
jgi:hypothetical protein